MKNLLIEEARKWALKIDELDGEAKDFARYYIDFIASRYTVEEQYLELSFPEYIDKIFETKDIEEQTMLCKSLAFAYEHIVSGGWKEEEDLNAGNEILRKGEELHLMENLKDNDLVWYAAFGSNLKEERFLAYIKGGRYQGNGKNYSGCHDTSEPVGQAWDYIKGRLYFARRSLSWNGGGVLYYTPNGNEEVCFRLYRITWGQFKDLVKQENGKSKEAEYRTDFRLYNAMFLGKFVTGNPVFTITENFEDEENAPSEEYLEVFREGLNETQIPKDKINEYLNKWLPKTKEVQE